ncbi:MAG: DAK2 domain-containing protein, partial [Candidatus Dormiibacterota bacterium]
NRMRMERAMAGVHAIEVTRAVRASHLGDRKIPVGTLIGMLDGSLVSAGEEIEPVVLEALSALPEGSIEVITLYRGADVETEISEALEAGIRRRFPDLEVERHDGGQALYLFVISAE